MSTNVNSVGIQENVQQFVVYQVIDPPNLTDTADGILNNVVLDSVGIGDLIEPVAPYDGQGIIVKAVASGEGTADVMFYNASAGTVNLASGTWKFIVTRAG